MQQLAALLHQFEPGSTPVESRALAGGLSARMTAVTLRRPDGRLHKMILRQPGDWAFQRNPQAAADEFRILNLLQELAVAAPKPYYLDASGEILGRPGLVLEYIDGRPDYAPVDVTAFACRAAEQLARIHAIPGPQPALSFLTHQADRLTRLLTNRPEKLDHSLDEGRIRDTLSAVWPLPQLNETVLLHGDFWPGNWLWRDGRLVAVVDWEDARLGDPLVDVAVTRLDLLLILGPEVMDAFTRCYRTLTAVDFSHLPYWDLYAALRPAHRIDQWAGGWPELGRNDITEATMRAGHQWFVAQIDAVLGNDRG